MAQEAWITLREDNIRDTGYREIGHKAKAATGAFTWIARNAPLKMQRISSRRLMDQ